MPVIERHIRIEAPVQLVWEVLVDLELQPVWMRDLRSVWLETPGPLRLGSVVVGEVHMFGMRQTDPIEVIAFDAPTHYGIAHLGAFIGSGHFHLTALADDATHVRWREDLHPTGDAFPLVSRLAGLPIVGTGLGAAADVAARVTDPLFTPVFEWVFRADLQRLKRLVEETVGANSAGAPRRLA
jgi:Polyketide cyclase / dehydrase and lipid transport